MPQILSDLSLNEISLVDNPACSSIDPVTGAKIPRARIALFKRDGGPQPTPKGEPPMAFTPAELEAKVIAMEPLIGQVAKLQTDNASLAAETIALKLDNEVLKMSAKQKKAFGAFGEDKKKKYMAADDAGKKEMMDAACAAMDAACAAMDEPDEDDAKKIAKLDAVVKAAEEREKASEARIAKVEAENVAIAKAARVAHFTKRAEDELPHTPGTPVEKGETLMQMADSLGGEEGDKFKKFFATMKSADEALKPKFGEIGKWGGGKIAAAQQLEALATTIAKRDNINIGAAMAKAMDENPALCQEHNTSRA